ncbi:uncharacterized protein [Cicer arietinum]|uniref:Uncharacterized protein LOC101509942 n=1 Tax=Cicer arietinum TaxID=3827 RepID=A0A1S2Y3I8_CICAR|nr:uncharacterized protein LOC101509942 [Cicer arietinum]
MKASLKFRDEQKKPLLRAKVPLSILGTPFQSGIVAGDSKELTLNLSTFFESGPSLKLSYKPNDSQNPFSLIVKTGTGPYGSPLSSSMLMSCEFNLLNKATSAAGGPHPLFMLHFKPRFGDFSFKKTQSSVFDVKKGFQNGAVLGFGSGSDDDAGVEVVESPVIGAFSCGKVPILGNGSDARGAIGNLFSGMEVAARTTVPIKGRAAVNFRWGVRVPAGIKGESAFQKVPFLVMDKIGVEHLPECGDLKKGKVVAGLGVPASGEVAETCFAVKRQMEVLQMGKGKSFDGRKNEKKLGSDFSGYPGKSIEADAIDESKKSFRGSTTVGV